MKAAMYGLVAVIALSVFGSTAEAGIFFHRRGRCCNSSPAAPGTIPRSSGTVVEAVQVLQLQMNDAQQRIQTLEAQLRAAASGR